MPQVLALVEKAGDLLLPPRPQKPRHTNSPDLQAHPPHAQAERTAMEDGDPERARHGRKNPGEHTTRRRARQGCASELLGTPEPRHGAEEGPPRPRASGSAPRALGAAPSFGERSPGTAQRLPREARSVRQKARVPGQRWSGARAPVLRTGAHRSFAERKRTPRPGSWAFRQSRRLPAPLPSPLHAPTPTTASPRPPPRLRFQPKHREVFQEPAPSPRQSRNPPSHLYLPSPQRGPPTGGACTGAPPHHPCKRQQPRRLLRRL
ncbi:hypothetical protein P7K49_003278 [Saguinus oedipus]|uniref:Uncharacterized protein n=1 Tax=Saguinus oedipus TaxID=9490 RepID=A0ABQ9WJQ8_SAGOE|nr:hypothetical protein P7K49_003278 [Saguinus oedipus]